VWFLAALSVGLALVATPQPIIGVLLERGGLGSSTPWIAFLAGTGAMVLTFLAGAELDPAVFRVKGKAAVPVGLAGFDAPFLACAAIS